jgi:hypothetical protein
MYDEQQSRTKEELAKTWRLLAVMVFVLFGYLIAWGIGGHAWLVYYSILVVVVLVVSGIFFGIHSIMALMARRDESMAKAFGDLLFAHSTSGGQMAKVITEVIRGANQMNRSDADVTEALIAAQAKLGGTYETKLAQLTFQKAEAESQLRVLEQGAPKALPTTVESRFSYLLPDSNATPYTMPEIE